MPPRQARYNTTSQWLFLVTASTLFLLLSISTVVVVKAECPLQGCGPFGECILDDRSCGDTCQEECKCNPGFAGSDCSFQAETCFGPVGPDDVRTCFNGGVCTENEPEDNSRDEDEDETSWVCDCKAAALSSAVAPKVVAGYQCEFVLQVSCEIAVADSIYAFCTNGGTCIKEVRTGKPHKGCFCGENHEGRHCQFKAGSAPKEELEYLKKLEQDDGAALSGVGIFFVVLFALAAVGSASFFLYRHSQTSTMNPNSNAESPVMTEADNDLQLDEAADVDTTGTAEPGNIENGYDENDDGDGDMHEAEII
jgi:hypothetical protein